MKTLLRLTICALLVAGIAHAEQPGYLGLFADPLGTDCNLYDWVPQVFQIYVVHHGTPTAQASRFRAPLPSCMIGAFIVAETTQWPLKIGLVQSGTLVGYGGCVSSPILVMVISVLGTGTTGSCCGYPILPDPSGVTGEAEVEGCDGVWRGTWALTAYVNPTPECYCTVASEPTTWGTIKALYTD